MALWHILIKNRREAGLQYLIKFNVRNQPHSPTEGTLVGASI